MGCEEVVPQGVQESALTGATKSGAIPLARTTGTNASTGLTGTTRTTLAWTAWATLLGPPAPGRPGAV